MPACHKFLLGFGEILTPNRYDMISETNPNPVARMKKIRMGAQFSSMLSVSQNRGAMSIRFVLVQKDHYSQPFDGLSMVGSGSSRFVVTSICYEN